MVVKFLAATHGGSNDVIIVGDFSVDASSRVVSQAGSTVVTLTVDGLTDFESKISRSIARGDYTVIS